MHFSTEHLFVVSNPSFPYKKNAALPTTYYKYSSYVYCESASFNMIAVLVLSPVIFLTYKLCLVCTHIDLVCRHTHFTSCGACQIWYAIYRLICTHIDLERRHIYFLVSSLVWRLVKQLTDPVPIILTIRFCKMISFISVQYI